MATNAPHVYIYLREEHGDEWIHALSIPHSDIARLTTRPLKWLRFAIFTVCGTKGHLSATPGGNIVDYENVLLNNIATSYYFVPDHEYHFIDIQAHNGRCTTNTTTLHRHSAFHDEIYRRDLSCIFTGYDVGVCEAAHVIPRRKGDNYISFVVHDRSQSYPSLPPTFSTGNNINIDCIQNGMLLNSVIHKAFDKGSLAFLKTPNFALEPADIPRVEQGPLPPTRITLQHIQPWQGCPLPRSDTRADWSPKADDAPLGIFLDYVYGVAIAKRFMSDGLCMKLEKWYENTYKTVLANPGPPKHSDSNSEDDDDDLSDPTDPDWQPPVMDAMDYVLYLPMLLKGISPEMAAAEWKRRREEEDLLAKEQSCERVQQWRASNAPYLGGTHF